MEAQTFTTRKQPVSGAAASVLQKYAQERSTFAMALDKAERFVSNWAGVRQVKTMDRLSPDAGAFVSALTSNQLGKVRSLLQQGFDANVLLTNPQSENKGHVSLLTLARSALAVQLLLEGGAIPNARNGVIMDNPLSTVIKRMPVAERIEAVDLLLQAGADPNGGAGLGASPLESAVARPDIGVVMLLIDAGAQVNKFAVLSAIQAHSERAHRASGDLWQVHQNLERTRQVVDLLVYASADKDLQSVLADKEVARLLKLAPDVAQLFGDRIPATSAETKLATLSVA